MPNSLCASTLLQVARRHSSSRSMQSSCTVALRIVRREVERCVLPRAVPIVELSGSNRSMMLHIRNVTLIWPTAKTQSFRA
jgi:hypothetical protein